MGPGDVYFRVQRVGLEEVRGLRNEVLRPGQPRRSTYFDGDDHPLAGHVAVRTDDDGIVCVGSVYPDPPPWDPDRLGAWRIRGMAAKEGFRGKGLGRRVLDALVDHAIANDGALVWCNARVGALDFYRKAGFETVGEVFDNGITLHQAMWRSVSEPDRTLAGSY